MQSEAHTPAGARAASNVLVDACLVFVIALAPRLLHLREIARNDPYFLLPGVDGRVYHEWATAIAAGDWVGEGVLTLGPLYPYLMAAQYALTGPDLFVLKWIHALLGAASASLVYLLARELFDRRVAWIAGLALAFSTMAIFYGGTVMVVNVQVPLVLGIAILSVRALRRPSVLGFLGVGCLLGLAVLGRQTVLLYLPVLAAWIVLGPDRGEPLERRVAFAGALAAGVALLVLPFTVRNWVVAGDPVLLSAAGGPNLYMGNGPGADGRWRPPAVFGPLVDDPSEMRFAFRKLAEAHVGQNLRASEVSRFWTNEALDHVADEPGTWLVLEGRKLLLFLNAVEIWNNRSVDVSRQFSSVLRLPLVGLGVLMPLGLLGLALTAGRWRELFPLHALLGVYLVSALVFFVLSRYRMPAVAILALFAAAAGVWLFDAVRAQRWRALAWPAAVLVLAGVVAHLDLVRNDLHMAWYNLGNRYRELERYDLAIESYERSLRANPAAVSTYNNLALALESAGRDSEAIRAWRFVLEAARRNGDRRRIERAERHLRALGAALEPERDRPS